MSFGQRRGGALQKAQGGPKERWPFTWSVLVKKRPDFNAYVGRTVRVPFHKGGGGEVVTIKAQSASYCPEGGLKRGFEDDQGWVVELRARKATDQETAAYVAREGRGS